MNNTTDNEPMTHVQAVHDQHDQRIRLIKDTLKERVARVRAEQQRDAAVAALREAESLIRGYRAGWDKDTTTRVLAPINAAIALCEGAK
jgi:hypothetical protein